MRLRDARLKIDVRKQSARPIIPATHHEPSLAATTKESRILRQSQRLFQQPANARPALRIVARLLASELPARVLAIVEAGGSLTVSAVARSFETLERQIFQSVALRAKMGLLTVALPEEGAAKS